MTTMIEVENLGKRYYLGGQDKYYKTLRESLIRGLKRPFQKLAGICRQENEFWALRNLNFTVDQGEVVGIIGRNGAGKSTLLKLLARITRPTEGRAKLYGRVGSLLEVGTGFHPELTGWENIYLSGNLLGMTRAEVKKKFDEIVDFSGVEPFLETPVKHFSTGMYVRLGFAIAAHLEPEILLVDEVLAVGDMQFQKKCLGKMDEVSKSGRTVLFVSHNMNHIEALCSKAIVLDHSSMREYHRVVDAIHDYFSLMHSQMGERIFTHDNEQSQGRDEDVKLLKVRTVNAQSAKSDSFDQTESFFVEIVYQICQKATPAKAHFTLKSEENSFLFTASFLPENPDDFCLEPGIYCARCEIPGTFLNTGTYRIDVFFRSHQCPHDHFYVSDALAFTITEDLATNPFRVDFAGKIIGLLRPKLEWQNSCCQEQS